jgi:hypothetical protein
MWLRVLALVLTVSLLPQGSHALMISAGLGLGSTEMKNEIKETEGPFTQVYSVERLFHSRLALGVEHIRSLKGNMTSSVSYSGILARYYINAAPMAFIPSEELATTDTLVRDYSVFIGSGVGNAQSSRLPDTNQGKLSSNAAGVYVSPRAGLDYQMGKNLGLRGEFIYAQTVFGSGNIQTMTLSGAIYWMF